MDPTTSVDTFERALEIDRARSDEEVLALLRGSLARYGLSACLVTGLPPREDRRWTLQVLLNDWPEGWYRRYSSAGHYRHDPCALRCRATAEPFAWSEVARLPLPSKARLVMDEASAFGLREGLCIPLHAPFRRPAAVTLAGEEADLRPASRSALQVLALHAYRRLTRPAQEDPDPAEPRLSEREREVLRWTAVGKTAWETSCILGISEHTVHTHLRNLRQKLEAANIVHAVVEALCRQEIQL